ncbi:hypothetical protein [Metabacillus litoralis]|uniref:hypothetical protein n=1 Tax=Metabacillus litoralis TaxID=152268 RepID=UPI00203DF45D|nr:hypothetical protein [Metabacillus litoralis]MCM3161110.1 hypothetical protein [Metabacillus litoralis]
MDDKLFEERMRNLKQSYEQVPSVSSVDKIVNKVKTSEKPYKKRMRLQLPYVASFIGVLLIGGILGAQLLKQPDNTGSEHPPDEQINQQPVTTSDIEAATNEIRGYYERKVDELNDSLQSKDVEQYQFVQEAKSAVAAFEQRKSYKSQTELKNYRNNVKTIIEYRVSMPYTEFTMLKNQSNISDEQILQYIDKLELLKEHYTDQWETHFKEQSVDVSNVKDYVQHLNSGSVKNGTEEYSNLVEEMKGNGYIFVDDGEGMISFTVDYDRISETFSKKLSEELKLFLDIQKNKRFKVDAELVISREELETRLIQLESIIIKYPNFSNINELKILFQDLMKTYLTGTENSQITTNQTRVKEEIITGFEQFISENNNTTSSQIVDAFLSELKRSNFQLTKELENQVESLIPLELKMIPNGLSINLLPLTNQMLETYEEYKRANNENVFNGPFAGTNTIDLVVARIYMYAVVTGDYDVAYDLIYKGGKGADIPDKSQFISEISSTDFQTLSNEVTMVEFQYQENGEIIKHIYIKGDGETVSLELRLENGYPKIVYKSTP